jgi:hypothetical protein
MAKMKQTLIKFISMGSMLSVKNNFTQQMQGLLTETTEIADMTGGWCFCQIRMSTCLRLPPFVGVRKTSTFLTFSRSPLTMITVPVLATIAGTDGKRHVES